MKMLDLSKLQPIVPDQVIPKDQLMSTQAIIKQQKEQHEEIEQIVTKHKKTASKTKEDSKVYEVYLRCVTWTRDSHGLFDYESKNIAKKNIKTQTGGKIIRIKDDIQLVSRNYIMGKDSKPMITLFKDFN